MKDSAQGKREDKNGVVLKDGDIIDIHQTVNGQNLFIVWDSENLDIRYHHDFDYEDQYDKESLLAPCKFGGQVEWEIVGNVLKESNEWYSKLNWEKDIRPMLYKYQFITFSGTNEYHIARLWSRFKNDKQIDETRIERAQPQAIEFLKTIISKIEAYNAVEHGLFNEGVLAKEIKDFIASHPTPEQPQAGDETSKPKFWNKIEDAYKRIDEKSHAVHWWVNLSIEIKNYLSKKYFNIDLQCWNNPMSFFAPNGEDFDDEEITHIYYAETKPRPTLAQVTEVPICELCNTAYTHSVDCSKYEHGSPEKSVKEAVTEGVREADRKFSDLTELEQQPYIDEAAKVLSGLHCCTRVWEAWQVGTMTKDDFVEADFDEDLIYDRAEMLFDFAQSQNTNNKSE